MAPGRLVKGLAHPRVGVQGKSPILGVLRVWTRMQAWLCYFLTWGTRTNSWTSLSLRFLAGKLVIHRMRRNVLCLAKAASCLSPPHNVKLQGRLCGTGVPPPPPAWHLSVLWTGFLVPVSSHPGPQT